jgi:hypothetical protein
MRSSARRPRAAAPDPSLSPGWIEHMLSLVGTDGFQAALLGSDNLATPAQSQAPIAAALPRPVRSSSGRGAQDADPKKQERRARNRQAAQRWRLKTRRSAEALSAKARHLEMLVSAAGRVITLLQNRAQ